MIEPWAEKRFTACLLAILALYLALGGLYVARQPLVMDEFQGAAAVDRLADELPYRDFRPYKTVLGYYLQLPFLALGGDVWSSILAAKAAMLGLNALAIGAAAWWLRRRHRPAAVLLATLALVLMSTFLERSAELRVDMSTAWLGLASLAFVLAGRAWPAGVLVGLSFLVSQKGVYFGVAGGAVFAWQWLAGSRDRAGFGRCLAYGSGGLAVLAAYTLLWTSLASWSALVEATFFSHGGIAFGKLYSLDQFWLQTMRRNPWFWGAAALALGGIFARRGAGDEGARERALGLYAAVLWALCLWHKQPWPYFFVLLIPTLWVLLVAFCDAELGRPVPARPGQTAGGTGWSWPFLAGFAVLAVALPLSRVPEVLQRDNGFQANQVRLAERLLGPGETYLAGLALVYTHRQAPGTLGWLDVPKLRQLETAKPADIAKLAVDLRAAPPKLVVWNYRLAGLPDRLKRTLDELYLPFWGAVNLYAPAGDAKTTQLELGYDGTYVVFAPRATQLEIAGRTLGPGESITLTRGPQSLRATGPFRLGLRPSSENLPLDPAYQKPRPLFENVYEF